MGAPLSPPNAARAGSTAPAASGVATTASRSELQLYLRETAQLFNSMDPAPFRERDLDPNAEAYIVDWAREAPARARLSLAICLGRTSTTPHDAVTLADAVHEYFRQRARATRARLRWLFRVGRISLLIGLGFVGLTVIVGDYITGIVDTASYARMIVDALVIGAWVALWRPMEIFLYDWWPIRAEARLFDRLSEMDVRLDSPREGDLPAAPAVAA
jgi:hypothetical protein